jgi:nicotinamidase-related amidase
MTVTANRRFVPGTEPYPWPYDGILTGNRLALVVAGAQQWWVERTHEPAAAIDHIARLRSKARVAGVLVVLVDHGAPRGVLAVLPETGDLVISAPGLDGFYGSALDTALRSASRDRLLVAGLGLEGPVHSTLRSANDRGYECLLVADACSCGDPALRDGAIRSVLMSGGIFGAVGNVDAVCVALNATATATANTAKNHEAKEMF